jgi:uncharacterized membrane protein YqjE
MADVNEPLGHGQNLHDKPLGELLRQLAQEIALLVRQELDLAKAEVAEKGKAAGVGAGMFGGAGVFGLGAFGALTACLIVALAYLMPLWASALVVAVLYGIVAGVLAMTGKRKIRQASPLVPEQTVETVKEDVQWAKTRMRSGAR